MAHYVKIISSLGNIIRFQERHDIYLKVPKFSDAIKFCCNLPKIQTKRPNFTCFPQKAANGMTNSEDPDQTAPQGAV